MDVLIESKTGNALTTIAIGDVYYNNWEKYAYPSWKAYCEKFGIGLFVMKEYANKDLTFKKKVHWEKFLVMSEIAKLRNDIHTVCYMDTDFLISPIAPNVFNSYTDESCIGLVSQVKKIPYPEEMVKRRIAFYRHNFYTKNYPLDSALFMSILQYSSYHNKKELTDITCSGFYIGTIKNHKDFFLDLFYKYDNTILSITDNGDEFHFNYETQQFGKIQLLDYRFQALWLYEMAWKFPFLYHYGRYNEDLIKCCIETSLLENYFLHFAGSWDESKMWTQVHTFDNKETVKIFEDFSNYCKQPVTGKPVGVIRPNTVFSEEK